MPDREPAAYDYEHLVGEISRLGKSTEVLKRFYVKPSQSPKAAQGDILHLDTSLPLIDEDGEPVVQTASGFWLLIGNTCDLERSIEEATFTQLVPIVEVGMGASFDQIEALKTYRPTRRFYLPPWNEAVEGRVLYADLLMPVTIHKKAVLRKAEIVARLSYEGWVLLHSCLVRFLARLDGRFPERS